MYLKSIEIQGFKSFANKTLFEFHNGITAIVGPNGSGKSNVADAVRWVLGEQSAKQLRGGSMQDVIFAGTEARKPQGMASVSITFDNSDHVLNIDFAEVTVTRRVFRSGESEYLINKTACRLRDINELFFDTGIGKEGYSIIGQGQIERILSSRPEDRRELFDEAAGIVKFKYRKATAVKRLDSEQENMTRLSDIMSELEKQIGPLKRQSETAREYLRLHDALRDREVNAFVLDSASSEQHLAEIDNRLTIVGGDLQDRRASIDELKKTYASEQQALESTNNELDESRADLDTMKASAQKNASSILVLQEQIRAEDIKRAHANERLETLAKNEENRKTAKEELETRRTKLHVDLYDATMAKERIAHETETLREEIRLAQERAKNGQEKVIDLLGRRSDIAADMEKNRTVLEQYRTQRAELDSRVLTIGSELSAAQKALKESMDNESKQTMLLNEQQNKLAESTTELNALRSSLSSGRSSYEELRRTHQATLTRQESLRNTAERYEGYGSSIRHVMEQKNRYPGICGVVADLIHVEKRYETAIETALGGAIQNIVTETERTAKELITFLKQTRGGRATFLPLDAMERSQEFRWQEALREPGMLGLANNLITIDEKYRRIFDSLLGRIAVADNIDTAMRVAARYHRSFRIVTLEGDLLNIGGSMTGGAYRNSSNLLSRSRELEEVNARAKKEQAELEKRRSAVQELQGRIEQAEKQQQRLRVQAEDARVQQASAHMQTEHEKKRFDELKETASHIDMEKKLLSLSEKEAEARLAESTARQQELDRDTSQMQTDSEESRQSAVDSQNHLNDLLKSAQETELLLSSLTQEDGYISSELDRITKEAAQQEKEQASLRQGLSDSETEKIRLTEQIENEKQEKEKQETLMAACSRKIDDLSNLLRQKTAVLQEFFNRQEELSSQISALEKEELRLTSQKSRQEEALNNLIQYLWTEYELQPSAAKAMATAQEKDLPVLKREIKDLKSQVKNLGPVNIGAIDEYNEVSERYSFMKTQYDDLVESRGKLLELIEELDTGMRKQFSEQFALIRDEFNRVFVELFGGGKGTIEIVEGEDILEAGISIISQPPGKKLQNMMQLSGGEKALTAIALLFAIQNLKPSPFCLLDEIEAALDDSNVGRYARYLHKLTEHTQFIVITHRRGTMTSADRLYGITMQEKGVSALVSVNLIEQQLDA